MAEFRRSGSFTLSPKKRTSLGGLGPLITPISRRQSISAQITPRTYDLIDGSEDLILNQNIWMLGQNRMMYRMDEGDNPQIIRLANQNNDEAERRERMLNRLQQLNPRASPTGTPVDRRKSLSIAAGLTKQQLSDHYAKCIQLSAENKINVKNAFDLQLIDYMTEMLKRKDSDMNNFQVASCTLDASTKIYAYRVDSIHTDTIKIAGNLGRTKEQSALDENGVEVPGAIDGKNKRKAKGKKHSTIETNLKNLDVAHFDLEFDVDPLFKKTATQFDEGRTGGGQFLSLLCMLDDSCHLVLDSETVLVNFSQDPEVNQLQITSLQSFPEMNSYISPTFSTFEFGNWNLSDDDEFSDISKLNKSADKLGSEEHAFDMNAVPEPVEELDNFEPEGLDEMECDYDATEGTVITIGKEACGQESRVPPAQLEVMHLKDHLSNVPLEYSYFDTRVMSAWAGPGHWRLKPLIKDKLLGLKPSGKKKELVTMDFVAVVEDLESHFAILRKPTKLSRNTSKNWSKSLTTLPIDLHYNPQKFSVLYLRLGIVIRKQKCETSVAVVDDSIAEYDYDNKNDQENYCADVDTGSNYGDNVAPGFEETCIFSQTILPTPNGEDDATMDFLGNNLVEAPNKVAQINIGYARTAKKIDMKKLKSTVWSMLSDPMSNKENERAHDVSDLSEKMKAGTTLAFSDLYKELPCRLPSKMAENISVSLAFIALLHLANEHSLNLQSKEQLGDFSITQG